MHRARASAADRADRRRAGVRLPERAPRRRQFDRDGGRHAAAEAGVGGRLRRLLQFRGLFPGAAMARAAQGRRHDRQGPDRQGPGDPGGGVRGAGRGDVLERRHLAQGHSLLVQPCAGRRHHRRRRRPCRHRRNPVDRAQQDPDRDRAVAAARPHPDDDDHARDELARASGQRPRRRAHVPRAAPGLGRRLFARPRPQRRPEDDGRHHRAALFDRLSPRRFRGAALGRLELLRRDRPRHADRRLADHRDDGHADHQARPAPGLLGLGRRIGHAVRRLLSRHPGVDHAHHHRLRDRRRRGAARLGGALGHRRAT